MTKKKISKEELIEYLRKNLGVAEMAYSPVLGWHFVDATKNPFARQNTTRVGTN